MDIKKLLNMKNKESNLRELQVYSTSTVEYNLCII